MRTGWRSGLMGTFVPVVHRSCPHNELAALALRTMGPLPPQVFEDLPERTTRVWSTLRRFVRRYDQGSWSHHETAMSYTGALRRRYLEAARSLADEGPSGFRDWYLRAFLKSEKNRSPSKMAKPRLIFPRSPRYNLELASRLKPFEHWLWGRLNGKVFGIGDGSRLVAKGLNPRQRANLIVRKFSAIKGCVCMEVDGAAFEAHVGPAQIREESAVYTSAVPGDGRLRWLLERQARLQGTVAEAKFSREGGRASGDFNTGMGNSLIFLCEVISALRQLNVHFDTLVDGDNALLFLPPQHLDLVVENFSALVQASSGHEVKLERPADYIEGIRFGGSAPVFLGSKLGWSMVREWNRVLSGAFSSHVHLNEPKFARKWMNGVARCELSVARGVPVLQAWAVSAIRALGGKTARIDFYRDYVAMGAWLAEVDAACDVTLDARISFGRAFGVTVDEQLRMEGSFDFSGVGCEEIKLFPKRFDHWIDEVGVHETWRGL
ncbi:putative RNA-dependent RNA polymerase [Phoma matteucciicola RNA virus 1]|nr:putative RNA-dependent RNA polymerase [Phoma matteucciicola RNA virus 1]